MLLGGRRHCGRSVLLRLELLRLSSEEVIVIASQGWIVLLRVVVGSWFLKAVWTKIVWAWLFGVIPYPAVSPRFLAFHPKRVAEFAAGNPVDWYRSFLEGTVLPNAALFATLQTYGEIAVGIGLVLGLLTGLAALVGLVLALNYGLATQWMTFGQQGFHVVLVTSMIILLGSRAGRLWGVDGWFLSRASEGGNRWLRLVM
jgi:thiosulfate dehydrogenase [quinone] large subunit